MLKPQEVAELNVAFTGQQIFREEMAQASGKEPSKSAAGDIANSLMENVSELRRAKHTSIERIRSEGDHLPAKILGDKEAEELVQFNYVSGCLLDVNADREAKEDEAVQSQWIMLKENHKKDIQQFQDTMQQSNAVFCEMPEWMEHAAQAAVAHRRKLKQNMGVTDEDILQVNVFALYSLGTVKKGCLTPSRSVCLASRPDDDILPSDPQQIAP